MNYKDLILKTRSYRRFDESSKVEAKTLETLINYARLSATGGNRQPLKFAFIHSQDDCDRIFPYLAWAGYLTEWPGPDKGERPTAYIVILGDQSVAENFGVDHGIAAQSILLGATDAGLGGCIIQSIKREELKNEFNIPDNLEVLLVLALGKTVENVILEEVKNDDIKYWRDENRNHHVPKRSLKDIILKLK